MMPALATDKMTAATTMSEGDIFMIMVDLSYRRNDYQ